MKSGPFVDFMATVRSIGMPSSGWSGPFCPHTSKSGSFRIQYARSTEWQPWCQSRLSTQERGWPCMLRFVAPEEIRLDDHVMQVKRAVLDPAADFAVRRRKAPRVRDHADPARRAGRVGNALGIRQVEAHRNLDLHVLALRQREHGLVRVHAARAS